ncbi:hypothetical protein CP09DC78_0283 [Chlamydia psittaci 09DC78]|nr:hypothetical protein CP09DC77_0287 [Chlamydia psittaci 09DC77]EPJ26712.1 hypothetical protein CP09DC80_0284 [Chlamydia psittaci 09DC80]EPJ30626.1 hypothetical protein CP09DC78_0283 [Chlamydia psittaci 09DC78]EPL02039.1 hypothetical protein CP09DC79_0014 [Chlamydia psittaci 09DC79]
MLITKWPITNQPEKLKNQFPEGAENIGSYDVKDLNIKNK